MVVNAPKGMGPVRAGALVGVVLAGGEGRRMGDGVSKPLRLLGGRPMVAHVVERLRPQVMDLVVVANDPDPAYRELGAPVIPDPPDIQEAAKREGRRLGPLAGILAGMEWSLKHHPHANWILTTPADVPFLPLDLTVRLCGHMHVPEPDVLTVQGEHALGVWSVKLAGDLRRAVLGEGLRRVEGFAHRHSHAELVWPGDAASFLNVNTPEDLSRAEEAMGRDRPGPVRPRSRR
ncbi:MAG: molybdenum cofactor guanylyltransferase [Alphaproteobacteria bacterium]|nr:molybdenum cofactor guanylyltransferase [Alphaproteobacteria bacterium]